MLLLLLLLPQLLLPQLLLPQQLLPLLLLVKWHSVAVAAAAPLRIAAPMPVRRLQSWVATAPSYR
jgi:hypothetical protein